jgi:hypothetical protein
MGVLYADMLTLGDKTGQSHTLNYLSSIK